MRRRLVCRGASRKVDDAVDDARDHRRIASQQALSAIASNTGCTSEGDEAITLKMSDVAVCRSNGCACSPLLFDAWPRGLFRNCPLQQPFDVNRTS
jgi:hypothetical protein